MQLQNIYIESFRHFESRAGRNPRLSRKTNIAGAWYISLIFFKIFFRVLKRPRNTYVHRFTSKARGKCELVLGKKHLALSKHLELDTCLIYIGSRPNIAVDIVISNSRLVWGFILFSPMILEDIKNVPWELFRKNDFRYVKAAILKNAVYAHLRPSSLLIYNDHTPYALLLAHMVGKKKVIYCQHAAVGPTFPPIDFAHNFLFSRHSYDIYSEIGISKFSKCYVVGDLLCSALTNNMSSGRKELSNKVLIAYNMLDSLVEVAELKSTLIDLGFIVGLRQHPRERRKQLPNSNYVQGNLDGVFDNYGVLVTNESSIVLEALVKGVLVYKYTKFSSSLDQYGFLKRGLLKREFQDKSDLIESIVNKEISYNSTVLDYFVGDYTNSVKNIKRIYNEIHDF